MEEDDFCTDYVIEKFLKRNFPRKRLRDGVSFRYGITIPTCYSGRPEQRLFIKGQKDMIYNELYSIVDHAFGFEPSETAVAVFMYLR